MGKEITTAREVKANPVNAVAYSPRTRANATMTGYVNDAIIRRATNLNSQYANTEPFNPSKMGARNEQEWRNFQRINRAAQNMMRRNRGRYF